MANPHPLLPAFGAALIAYLHQATPRGRRILLKVPGVPYLDYFYHIFPHEHVPMLTRDGRDVVQSTLKAWPPLRFSMVCARERRSAQMVMACHQRYRQRGRILAGLLYEDALRDPESFVRAACERLAWTRTVTHSSRCGRSRCTARLRRESAAGSPGTQWPGSRASIPLAAGRIGRPTASGCSSASPGAS